MEIAHDWEEIVEHEQTEEKAWFPHYWEHQENLEFYYTCLPVIIYVGIQEKGGYFLEECINYRSKYKQS